MIYVSPCGWYCFSLEDNLGLQFREIEEKTRITKSGETWLIEISTARKNKILNEDEISQFHEEFLRNEKLEVHSTSMRENPFEVVVISSQAQKSSSMYFLVAHAFWSSYFVAIVYQGNPVIEEIGIEIFKILLSSLQPLTLS